MAMASEGSSAGLNISSLSITTQSSIALEPVDKNMEKIMECPVCNEIPLPPIYTCKTGHFTCETCQKKLFDECPLCKSSFTTSRNYALESIILTSKFYCNHRQNLCIFTGTIDDLKVHHGSCAFRPMKCHRTGLNGCTGTELYFSQYVQHLKDAHGIGHRKNSDSRLNVFLDRFIITDWEEETSPRDTNWAPTLICYNNEVFTSNVFASRSTFYFGFYLIGSETSASKYAVKITIEQNFGSTVPKFELTIPVPSIREISKGFGSEGVLPSVALHKDLMKALGTFTPLQQNVKRQLELKVMYEIIILNCKTK